MFDDGKIALQKRAKHCTETLCSNWQKHPPWKLANVISSVCRRERLVAIQGRNMHRIRLSIGRIRGFHQMEYRFPSSTESGALPKSCSVNTELNIHLSINGF